MKFRLLTLVSLILTTTSIFSKKTEIRNMNSFNSISVTSGLIVNIRQSESSKVELEAPNSYLNDIITKVKGETLNIYVRSNSKIKDFKKIKINVSAPAFQNIVASGGAYIGSIGHIKTENLYVDSSGGADIYITSETQSIKLICSGGADIGIEGSTESLIAKGSGDSNVYATELNSKRTEVYATAGSDVFIQVIEGLKAKADKGAHIWYTGNPKQKDISENGGDIKKM